MMTVLEAAYAAWQGGSVLRRARARNKRFAYGDQWGDPTVDDNGRTVTEGERYSANGHSPITNNLIRQLVKTVVGRFRAQHLSDDSRRDKAIAEAAAVNQLDELDSRAMEEFLISGCAVQRVDRDPADPNGVPLVDNVNINRLFVNNMTDVRSRDCEIVGQLHDLSLAALLQRVAGGSRRKAAWVRRLYCDGAVERVSQLTTRLGLDSEGQVDFWHAPDGKCRAIEVWTLESREVVLCHNRATADLQVLTPAQARRVKQSPEVSLRWDVTMLWHCRWYSPMGDLLAEYDSPLPHGGHPFVLLFYPLTDGEVHAFVEDVIDQQKFLNRLVTLTDHIMSASAKGVLLYPETALPEGYTWSDVRRIWGSPGGILPYSPQYGEAKPEQLVSNLDSMGAYRMIDLQMRLLDEVSGVSGAMQGKVSAVSGTASANLYRAQAENADVALSDIYATFNNFRRRRDAKLASLSS